MSIEEWHKACAERDRLAEDNARLRDALEGMCFQYLSVRAGKLCHDYMSAGENAFDALGWPDDGPPLPEGFLCDEPGCLEQSTCGFPVSDERKYRRTCHEHYRAAIAPPHPGREEKL